MTIKRFICDICKQEIPNANDIYLDTRVPMIFHSETTEGIPTEPHLETEKVDICKNCLMRALNIHASGAQGNNYYWFGSDRE